MSLVKISAGKVNGKPIIKAWESFSGWYWLGTEKVREQLTNLGNGKAIRDTIWFGFVIGPCPEWGYFSEAEIKSLAPWAWEIQPRDIPYISKEVRA